MQDLYPIIRRKRRPLIVEDAPPVAVGNVEPVNAEVRAMDADVEAVGDPRSDERSDDTER